MRNFLALYGIQITNGIVPLLIFPHLLKIYGAEQYESLVLAEIFSILGLVFVSFGFEITSVKKLKATAPPSVFRTSFVYFQTVYSRIVLWLVFFFPVIVFLISFSGVKFGLMVLGWSLLPLGFIFYSHYFHLVFERNFELFVALSFGRGLGILLAVGFEYPSIHFVPFAITIPFLLIGITFFVVTKYSMKLRLTRVRLLSIFRFSLESVGVFKNAISLTTLKEFNLVIVSHASGDSSVTSTYSILDKFLRAGAALMRPLAQYFMPKIMILMKNDRKWYGRPLFMKVLLLQIFVVSIGILVAYSFPYWDVFVGGAMADFPRFNLYLSLMLVSIYFGVFNYYFLVYSAIDQKTPFLKMVVLSGLLGMVFLYFATSWFQEIGFSVAFILPELMLSVITLIYVRGRFLHG